MLGRDAFLAILLENLKALAFALILASLMSSALPASFGFSLMTSVLQLLVRLVAFFLA